MRWMPPPAGIGYHDVPSDCSGGSIVATKDVDGLIGAGRHEHSGEHTTWRNGYRERALDTRLGTLNLRVPKLRQGSYFPSFLEARKTSEQALVAVIQGAWISGVSTSRVDELVQAIGLSGISKSTVSNLCKDIDEGVGEFLNRPLTGEWPYLWLDAQRTGPCLARPAHGRCRSNPSGLRPTRPHPCWSDVAQGC